MDTRQLAAFCAVVDRKSFSQAAEQLGVTQPAVSLQIRSLEKRLGERLLDRSGRRVEPTEAGVRLYRSAQRLLALEQHLLEEVAGDGDELHGRLEIGCSTGPGATVLPLLLCEFQAANPGVAISLSVNDTLHVIDLVAERRLELGVVGAAPRHRAVTFEPFFQDEVVLAVPPKHPLAGKTVALDDLRSEALILMQEGAGVRQMVEDELRSAGLRVRDDVDGILAVGGGSAIDTAKAASAENGLPVVSVPTTYSGAEWPPSFGVRDSNRRTVGGGGGAHLAGIVYDPELTLDLPREPTVGTALNALAHAAEALYHPSRTPESDRVAHEAAELINGSLPAVVDDLHALGPRKTLLEGACKAGEALALSGLCLGHAMAQAIGGRYGLPHGAMNALCLPAALRFNEPVAAQQIEDFGKSLGTDDPAGRVEELARLGGFNRLRDFGVREDELEEVAEAAAVRGGAKANPRPASPAEIAELYRSIY